MITSSIYETFTLPSKGKIYDTDVNPTITLRSMTTLEEMKRLSPTDTPYKAMSDIIEACMQQKPEVSVYDMALGDYQFLLHKLRVVTYGPEYKMSLQCDNCGEITKSVADLDSLELREWTEDIIKKKIIYLPRSKNQIELKFQTPRDLDSISYESKEFKKKTKQDLDYTIMFSLMSLINKIDGQSPSSIRLEEFVKSLPNMDANYIFNKASELNNSIGLDTVISCKCDSCGSEMRVPFRITSEFFGPTID